jgi:hypothetical protein
MMQKLIQTQSLCQEEQWFYPKIYSGCENGWRLTRWDDCWYQKILLLSNIKRGCFLGC